jgi:hypothetical protein
LGGHVGVFHQGLSSACSSFLGSDEPEGIEGSDGQEWLRLGRLVGV